MSSENVSTVSELILLEVENNLRFGQSALSPNGKVYFHDRGNPSRELELKFESSPYPGPARSPFAGPVLTNEPMSFTESVSVGIYVYSYVGKLYRIEIAADGVAMAELDLVDSDLRVHLRVEPGNDIEIIKEELLGNVELTVRSMTTREFEVVAFPKESERFHIPTNSATRDTFEITAAKSGAEVTDPADQHLFDTPGLQVVGAEVADVTIEPPPPPPPPH